MFTAKTQKKNFEISSDDTGLKVDGALIKWDLLQVSSGEYHILFRDKGYAIEIVEMNRTDKTISLKVNNKLIRVSVRDRFDQLLEKMGLTATAGVRVNQVRAPMPGLVVEVRIKVGDQVAAGDPLIILEAMKMENIIRSTGDGIVKKVNVTTGQGVEKNQVLVEF